MTLEDDYTRFLMAAGDDDTLIRVVSNSAISKLRPVLKANGIKGISKMKKADIVEAIIELVRARKAGREKSNPQADKYNAVIDTIAKANTLSEVRQIFDKNFTVKELLKFGWVCFKENNLPKGYIVDKHVVLCIHRVIKFFLKRLQDFEPRVDMQKLFQLYLGNKDLPDTTDELNEYIIYKFNGVLAHVSFLTGIKPNWDIWDALALYRYLVKEIEAKKAAKKPVTQERTDEDFIAEYNMLLDEALPPQSEYMNVIADKAQSLLKKAKTFNEKEDLLNTYYNPLIELLYARYTGQPAASGTGRSLMIRAIMRLIEVNSPEAMGECNIGQRILEAKSKAERIAILQNSTFYGLYNFANLKHESLKPAPYISFEYESRRSAIEKCISRLRDDA